MSRSLRDKQTKGLLLSLMVVLAMVVGAFGMAINMNVVSDSDTVAANELESGTREIDTTPIHAQDQAKPVKTTESMGDLSWNDGNPTNPISAATKDLSSDGARTERGQEEPMLKPLDEMASLGVRIPEQVTSEQTPPVTANAPTPPSTMATVDANGPYGTMGDPKYEGDPVDFNAAIVGGNNDDYFFRWDVTGDGEWNVNYFPPPYGTGVDPDDKGKSAYTHEFKDNNIGKATVEAWDGVSMKTESGGGYVYSPQKNAVETYWSWTYYWTVGYEFNLYKDVTVDELGYYDAYYPLYIYNIRIWTDTGTLMCEYLNPSPQPNYDWGFWTIPDCPLIAGTYRISSYLGYYYFPAAYGLAPTPDGIVEPLNMVYGSGNSFPGTDIGSDPLPMLDFHYYYYSSIPDTLSDTAEVFVDNRNPVVTEMSSDPVEAEEGREVSFTGSFSDMGEDDEWEYRWLFGDGTSSPWRKVMKFSGGANVLLLHSLGPSYITNTVNDLIAACGAFCIGFDEWGFGPLGNGALPSYEYLLGYHVIIISTNFFVSPSMMQQLGDMLADWQDETGGGVIVNAAGAWASDDAGIGGRWYNDGYSPVGRAYFSYGFMGIGAADWGHDIMQGVTSISAYYHHNLYGVTSGADWVADYTSGEILVATKENPVVPNGALSCFFNYFPGGYSYIGSLDTTGDWDIMMANAIKYCSRRPDPEPLDMPIPTDPVTHFYKDDHPLHVTPQDSLTVTLEVKDDDHGKSVPIGDVTTILDQDFSTGMPPSGWYRSGQWYMDWILSSSTNAGGSSPEAWFVYYNGWGFVDYGRLHTGPIDTTGFGALDVSFKEYLSHYGGPYTLMVETSPDGVTWTPVWQLVNPSGYGARTTTFTTSTNIGIATTYFSWTFYGDPWNLNWWCIDDIYSVAFEAYTMEGLGTGEMPLVIKNVEPSAIVPPELQNYISDEMVTVDFQGLEITDPALTAETEAFWYKVNFDDGYETNWMYKGVIAPPVLKVLVYHSLDTAGGPALQTALKSILPESAIVDQVDFYTTLVDADYMSAYDVVVTGVNLAPFDADYVGNELAKYADMGGNVVETVATFYTTCGWWGVCGDWRYDGYTTMQTGGIGSNQAVQTIYDPDHPIIDGEFGTVTTFSGGIPVSVPGPHAGSTYLAKYPSYAAIAYNDEFNPNPGAGRTVGINVFYYPGYYGNDELVLLANAIWWASQIKMPTPVLDPFTHPFGDNGVYDVDLMIIDDDMNWYWDINDPTPDPPVWVGSGDPVVTHNVIPIGINNVAPEIEDVSAYVEGDLCLRLSGNKGNEATLEVFDGTNTHSLTLIRDPNEPEFGCLEDLKINVEMSAGAYVKVIYTPSDDDGANPTWITEGYWPGADPHKIKVTFNSKKGVQEKYVSWGELLVGDVPINFEVTMNDPGSDAIGFIWDWGDTTPFGIHVYDALTQAMCGGANEQLRTLPDGTPSIFTGCTEPIFIKEDYGMYPGNNIRSPEMSPTSITDLQQHIFGQYYLYYLTVTVADDDNSEGYPSSYLTDGIDIDLIQIDLRK